MNNSTITAEQANAIRAAIAGASTSDSAEDRACIIDAINLGIGKAATGRVPACMSCTVGDWVIQIHYALPAVMRSSERWTSLMPLAAGTGRVEERVRCTIAMEWTWGVAMPQLQPVADRCGLGEIWKSMTLTQSYESACAAAVAANASDVPDAHYLARAAGAAANAVDVYSYALSYVPSVDDPPPYADHYISQYARAASYFAAAVAAGSVCSDALFWEAVDPCSCLGRMIGLRNR